MLVAFQYDNGAAGALYYSREVPSFWKGLRLSKLFGRRGVITFESNGSLVLARGGGLPRVVVPGWLYDIRGYRAMYRDFIGSIRAGRAPEMSLERALEDHRLMERVYETLERPPVVASHATPGLSHDAH
jgi:predicted dehydrogenase